MVAEHLLGLLKKKRWRSRLRAIRKKHALLRQSNHFCDSYWGQKHPNIQYYSWWFQPIWKICSSKWVHLPQIGQIGVKIKHIWVATTQQKPAPTPQLLMRTISARRFLLDSALSRTCCLPRCVFLLLLGKVSSSWWNWLLLDWWFIYIWGWEKMTKLQTCCLWWSAVCQKEKTLSGLKATFLELFFLAKHWSSRPAAPATKFKMKDTQVEISTWQHISLHHWVKWLFWGSCANMANKRATTERNSYNW